MTLVPIGTFARMTHLGVKRLRHYHDTGVLEAAHVDPATGYRYYDVDQSEDARTVARLRVLDVPLPQIAAILAAPADERRELLAGHLGELQERLTTTQGAVASVRAMLGPLPVPPVEYRDLPPMTAVVREADVRREDIDAWCAESFGQLYAGLGDRLPAGPGAATYDDAFFADDVGRVMAYVPVAGPGEDTVTVPGGRHAVAIHEGPFGEVDGTYAALGRHVSAAGVGLDGPIRETYLVGLPAVRDPARFRTEIAWPVTGRPRAAGPAA